METNKRSSADLQGKHLSIFCGHCHRMFSEGPPCCPSSLPSLHLRLEVLQNPCPAIQSSDPPRTRHPSPLLSLCSAQTPPHNLPRPLHCLLPPSGTPFPPPRISDLGLPGCLSSLNSSDVTSSAIPP